MDSSKVRRVEMKQDQLETIQVWISSNIVQIMLWKLQDEAPTPNILAMR